MALSTSFTSLLTGSSTPFLASGDVVAFIDISDHTQSVDGSTVKGTLTQFFAQLPVPVAIASASATAFTVGLNGATNPAFAVDDSTALQVAGLKVTGAVTGGTVAVVVTDSGAATNLTLNAKGTGTIGIGSVSTGRVTISPVMTITGSLTLSAALVYGGVTLSNAVTGTGNMVLSASPTFTGTVTAATITASGLITASAGATVASSQTLTVTGATITGLTAASVGTGTFPGVYTVTGALTLSAALTYGGVTLSNAVTGTGNMVLSASPTLTGTIVVTGATITGLTAASVATGTFPGVYTVTGALTLSAALTYGGVTLSNAVTGTGNMVLSAGPTFTGTAAFATVTASSTINGQTISSAANFTGTATFAGLVTINGSANKLLLNGGGTSAVYQRFSNTSGDVLLGLEGSVAGGIVTGTTAYSSFLVSDNATDMALGVGQIAKLIIKGDGSLTTISTTTTAVQALTAAGIATFGSGSGGSPNAGSLDIQKDLFMATTQGVVIGGARVIAFSSGATSITTTGGISATTGTFSTSAKTASGSTSCPDSTSTSVFVLPGVGAYIAYFYDAGGANFKGAAAISYDGTNTASLTEIVIGSTISYGITAGHTIQITQSSGSTKTMNWSYFRIN